ncbi:MAG: hypothetical protein IJC48_08955 [Clostridia bacterium]|nr:hypothetical protein [Clostridia bacterium]
MANVNNSIPITSVAATILTAFGIEPNHEMHPANDIVLEKMNKILRGEKADRVFMFNPDAIALWLYQKYTALFTDAVCASDLQIPMLSVMPSVTPVCFASIYSGVMPDKHGIQKYEKPVLTVETVFDVLIKNGKKCAIVSTAKDSISCIFLNREMDYYIYETMDEVNEKARELIDKDEYDLIVVYNKSYDYTMHKQGPEAEASLNEIKHNAETYKAFEEQIAKKWPHHNTMHAFCPDHGCHEIDGDCGSHGLDMPEDMNIIHMYGFLAKK